MKERREIEYSRIVSSDVLENEVENITLRPKHFSEFVGQKYIKSNLEIFVQSCKKRMEPLEHTLLSGPPGLGKTTVAHILATDMGVEIVSMTGPSIKKANDLVSILLSLKRGDIFFIDEVHGLSKAMEEILYPAIEDFKLTFTQESRSGKKADSKVFVVKLKRFTLVGATTKVGSLSAPFRDRFGITLRFELYHEDELIEIIRRSSAMLGIPITPEGVMALAKRSRGTPRIANRLLRRVRDFAIVKDEKEVTKKGVDIALGSLRIDYLGLDDLDRKILMNIWEFYGGGPVGVKSIAMSVGEDVKTIEEVYEPYLAHIGFLKRTSGGREITQRAIDHLEKVGQNYGIAAQKKKSGDGIKLVSK